MTFITEEVVSNRLANADLALARLTKTLNVHLEDSSLWQASNGSSFRCVAYVAPLIGECNQMNRRIEVRVNFLRNTASLISYTAIDTDTNQILAKLAA